MNKAVLIGYIANDPETRTTQSGISRASFRIAVSRDIPNAQGVRETDFLNVVCWRQSADFVSRYMRKGDRIAVVGNIQSRTYEAQDGSKRTIVEIVAERVESLSKREDADRKGPEVNTFVEVDDDELPF